MRATAPRSRGATGSALTRRCAPLWGLVTALVLGGYARLAPLGDGGFPVNDGGLFYLMTRELQQAGYALPAFTSYNDAAIPFAYPPLGFYLAGWLSDLAGWDLLAVMRLLPALLSVAAIPAFFALSRALLDSPRRAALATVAFALLPRTFLWFVMGGGLTRAPGFLFALLMLHQAHRMYTRPGERRYLVTTTLLAALAVASHLENAWFGAYSAALLFLFYGRHRRGALDSLLVVAGVLALTAPHQGAVAARHGVRERRDAGLSSWVPVKRFQFTGEPYLPLLGVLGLIGGFLALAEGALFAPVWLAVIFVVNPRNAATPATVPLAILVGVAVDRLLGAMTAPGRERGELRGAGGAAAGRAQGRSALPRLAAGLMLGYLTLYAATNAIAATTHDPLMTELPRAQRVAMRWVADSTPAASAFVAMSCGAGWFGADRTAEWFPALAGRADLVTVQGYEWLPGRQFAARIQRYDAARACGRADAQCLEAWASGAGRAFTHVFVPAESGCEALAASLRASPAYARVYERDGVAIFERRRSAAKPARAAYAAGAENRPAGAAGDPSPQPAEPSSPPNTR